MAEPHLYQSFGLPFSSEIELHGTAVPPPGTVPLLRIRRGSTPSSLPDAEDAGSFHGIAYEARPGAILITVAGVASYFVRRGSDITVSAVRGVSPDRVRVYLMGSAFGALLQQRGLVSLHASVIRVGDVAVGFTGRSGAGKSTLAARFGQMGYPVLCDDLCPVAVSAQGEPLAWAGFRRIKVWVDALHALGLSPEGVPRVINKCDKYELPAGGDTLGPVPLRRLYVLEARSAAASNGSLDLGPLDEQQSLESLLNNTYRFDFLKGMGLRERHFRSCALALSGMRVFRLTRDWDLSGLHETARRIESEFHTLDTETPTS